MHERKETKPSYYGIIPELDTNSQENITQKHLGVLVSLHSMFIPSSREEYSSPTARVMPERTVMVSIVQKQEHKGKYGEQEYTFYCTVEDVEYEVSDHDKLQILINKSLDTFKRCENSKYHLPRYSKDIANNVNYAVKLSIYIIKFIWFKSDNVWGLLRINNLEKRFEAIELILLQLLNKQKKVAAQEVAGNANEFIKEVSEIPEGFNIVLFYVEVEKYLSLSTFGERRLCNLSILTSEQIEQNYYSNDYTLLLVKERSEDFFPRTSIAPSILARVNNVLIRKDEEAGAEIYFAPEKRVQVTEVVLKDGVFYGKAEEIVEPKSKNREELYKLRELVEKLIKVYQCEDYQGHTKYPNSAVPIFNHALVNFETYAANLSFYIAEKSILDYIYRSYTDKDITKKFCAKSTIDKLQYLIEYIESTISSNLSKSNKVVQDKVLATDSSNTFANSSTLTFTSSKELLDLAYSQIMDTNEVEKALESYNKALELDPSNQDALAFKAIVLIYHFKQYQEALDIYDKYPDVGQMYLTNKGNAYYFLEKYNEAINCYDQIAVDSKEYVYSCYKKGLTYYSLGNYVEAVKSFDEALKLNEQSAVPIPESMKMSVLDSLFHDDFIEAQEHNLKIIEGILTSNPQSSSALVIKMRLLNKLGKYDEALSVSNKLLELNPDTSICIYYKGNILENLERYEEALQYINKAIMLNNSNLDWITYKGTMLFKFEKYQEAITVYDEVLSQQPKSRAVLTHKAHALSKMEKHDEALKILKDVLAMNHGTN